MVSLVYVFEEDYLQNDTLHSNLTLYVPELNLSPCAMEPDPAIYVTLCLILIAIFLLAIPGNLMVGWVISTSRQALTPSDMYLFHLTVADGLMALTLPFWAVAMVQGWVFGDFMCKFLNLVIEANFYTSILFLACISIDRYLVIVHASESLSSRQRKRSWILCAAVWALGWALALPALFYDASKPNSASQKMVCSENFNIGRASSWRLATRLFRHIFGFFLPLGVMIACYSVTIARLLHTRGFRKHRAMKVIIAVVIAFLLCWTPYNIAMMVDTSLRAGLIPNSCAVRNSVEMALLITNSMALLHSCINPVLYAFVAEKFRRKIVLLLQRKVRQERLSGSKFSRSTSQTSEGNGAVL
ncbi:C-X-C chemokine receptor type 1-like [Micropterus dolomieu]|uniref:C-X-C chemokine receptor type 1-like n=1 Tax=Micropterus dolomieu TaxID=147949 RepID=UPI001E8D6AA2|nr:C-X-C chemokine receptor type 1-like [Micropterus dolomieu]XP_045905473.1 C-X-C chemokine receptor type 1-like [Micropterus dolomieu]